MKFRVCPGSHLPGFYNTHIWLLFLESTESLTMATAGGGFSFDLCNRNELMRSKGAAASSFTKTGTTIAGIIFKVF